jgi:hypothetical protein
VVVDVDRLVEQPFVLESRRCARAGIDAEDRAGAEVAVVGGEESPRRREGGAGRKEEVRVVAERRDGPVRLDREDPAILPGVADDQVPRLRRGK